MTILATMSSMAAEPVHVRPGDRYGHGTVIAEVRLPVNGDVPRDVRTRRTKPGVLMRCDCGRKYTAKSVSVRNGHVTSCGCGGQA